jgi:hypothetical protein
MSVGVAAKNIIHNQGVSGYNKNLLANSINVLRGSKGSSKLNGEEEAKLRQSLENGNNKEIEKANLNKNGDLSIPQVMDIGLKIIACENFQSYLTILHVGNSIVIYEITYENDERGEDYETDIILQLYISTFS